MGHPSDFCAINIILWIYYVKNALSVLPIPPSLNAGCAEVFVSVIWSLLRPTMTVVRGHGKQNTWKKREDDVRNSE